jgi:hypothetical protein
MSKHFRIYAGCISALLMTAASHVTGTVRFGWEALRHRDDQVSLEVLVADGKRRRKIERELCAGLRQLQHVLGPASLVEIAIVVQQVITMDRQLAGCYQLSQRPDGSQSALLRVALEVNHTRLSSAELLAVEELVRGLGTDRVHYPAGVKDVAELATRPDGFSRFGWVLRQAEIAHAA